MTDTAADKLTKAKAKLVLLQPFFAHIVLTLPLIEREDLVPPTMATDMKQIFYHPKFVDDHSLQEIIGVLAHEALHVAYFHGTRKGDRLHVLWNIACDYAINPIVLDAGMKLPEDRLFDAKYVGMSAQEIYEDLKKNMKTVTFSFPGDGDPQGGDGGQDGQPMWGGVMPPQGQDGKPAGKAETAQLEQEIKITVSSAAAIAKSRGTMPGGIEGLIEAIGKPTIDWHDYIQRWVSGHNPDDYSWARPNRRMLANHRIYMPRLQLNGCGTGLLSIDTSGSVSDNELRKYVREIVGVIEMCRPDKLIIVQHDAIIQKVDIWEAGEDFSSLSTKGRGGTCIAPTFDYANNLDEPIDWMICLTDCGICDYPKIAPDYPVLWAASGPDNTPFGTYIPIKDAMGG